MANQKVQGAEANVKRINGLITKVKAQIARSDAAINELNNSAGHAQEVSKFTKGIAEGKDELIQEVIDNAPAFIAEYTTKKDAQQKVKDGLATKVKNL